MWEWMTNCTTATTATTTSTFYVCQTASSSTATTSCYQATNAMQFIRYAQAYNSATNSRWYSQAGNQEAPEVWMERQRRAQAKRLEAHSREARERAMGLLLDSLSPAQRETFEKKRWFVVEGGKSGKKYRIHANDNVAANIEVLEGERVSHRLCGHCDISKVPLGDHLLAQKLTLQFAEDDFLRIANRHAA